MFNQNLLNNHTAMGQCDCDCDCACAIALPNDWFIASEEAVPSIPVDCPFLLAA